MCTRSTRAIVIRAPAPCSAPSSDRRGTPAPETLSELPDLRGNVMHDVHTAVLMREHGISRICTRDTAFRRFPFLTVVDPLSAS